MRPPRLRCTLFPSIYPPHLLCSYKCGSYLTLLYFANSSLRTQPYMRFLSVGPEVCLQLPSDSSSRKTPLLFSYTLPTTWVCSGLAPVRARPWRANKMPLQAFPPIAAISYSFVSALSVSEVSISSIVFPDARTAL